VGLQVRTFRPNSPHLEQRDLNLEGTPASSIKMTAISWTTGFLISAGSVCFTIVIGAGVRLSLVIASAKDSMARANVLIEFSMLMLPPSY
jgi:hypothetical protein